MSNTVRVIQGSQSTGAVVVKKGGDLTLQGLSNVVPATLPTGTSVGVAFGAI